MVLRLTDQGRSQTDIAHLLGCGITTVHDLLQRCSDTRPLATARSRNRATEIAEATISGAIKAAKAGKPESGLELLDRLGVAEKRLSTPTQVGVIVQIGAKGLPIGPQLVEPIQIAKENIKV